MTSRTIIVRDKAIMEVALNAIRYLPFTKVHPWEVILRPYKVKRRTEANNLYWLRLGEISQQAWINGRQYPAEVLHEYLKRQFLPETCNKGFEKWITLPSGDRALGVSTTDLNTTEFADYMTAVECFGAELGVHFSTNIKEPQ